MAQQNKLLIIAGPTASGKTAAAITHAQMLETEIVSADSRQIYRELKIGAAPPSSEQRTIVPHYLIATHSVADDLNSAQFSTLAREALRQIWKQHETAILVGGSGLYINAIVNGLKSLPGKSEAIRANLQLKVETEGLEALAHQILSIDAQAGARLDLKNPNRIIRALEVREQCGLWPWQIEHDSGTLEAAIEFIFLNPSRDELYARINNRVDEMIAAGLEEEARALYPWRHCNALQTVGYREWWPYFEGGYELKTCVDLIKQHTRNYAKRQVTWFKKYGVDFFKPR